VYFAYITENKYQFARFITMWLLVIRFNQRKYRQTRWRRIVAWSCSQIYEVIEKRGV